MIIYKIKCPKFVHEWTFSRNHSKKIGKDTTDTITKCEVTLILNINILTVNYTEVDNQKIMNLSKLYMIGESKSEYEH